jgi:hypothetical protein
VAGHRLVQFLKSDLGEAGPHVRHD